MLFTLICYTRIMSEPIQETTETNSSRRKGLEAWAASMAARQQPPGPPPGPEQDNSGPAYTRPGAAQRPHKIKTVTKIQKQHQARKADSVDLARNSDMVQPEMTMKAARDLVKGGVKKPEGTVSAQQSQAPPPTPQSQTVEVKVEKAIQQANDVEVAESAETVTAEEVQANPGVAGTVNAKAVKSTKKTEKAESAKEVAEAEEAEEESETPLIEPGNSLRASAYVRAGDYMPEGSADPDLDDYVLAL